MVKLFRIDKSISHQSGNSKFHKIFNSAIFGNSILNHVPISNCTFLGTVKLLRFTFISEFIKTFAPHQIDKLFSSGLDKDNVVSSKHLTLEDLNIKPDDVEKKMQKWLWRFREKGQFAEKLDN